MPQQKIPTPPNNKDAAPSKSAELTSPLIQRPLPPRHHAKLKTYLLGMLHLPRLLEGPAAMPMRQIVQRAITDAQILTDAGFDALIIENFGDTPFYPDQVPPHTVAAITRVACAVQDALHQRHASPPHLGINVLRNDAIAALSIAAASDAAFVRINVHSGAMITDQGIIEGKAHITLRLRQQIAPNVRILADIRVKHAAPIAPRLPADEALDTWQRAHADGIVLSGSHTGSPTNPRTLQELREALPECPLYIGSGATIEQLPNLLPHATGLIVGTSLKYNGISTEAVDPQRAEAFVRAVHNHR